MNIYIWHEDYSIYRWRIHAMEFYIQTLDFRIAVNSLSLVPKE